MSSFDEYIEAHNAAVRSGDWEAFSDPRAGVPRVLKL